MKLDSLDNSRQSLAAIMKKYHTGKDSGDTQFRNLVHSFSVLLQYFKAGELAEIERRLDELEDKTGTETTRARVMEGRKK